MLIQNSHIVNNIKGADGVTEYAINILNFIKSKE